MNSAIIVAAGRGVRFGSDLPKQFLEICGKPLISHTLNKFDNCEAVDEIILVTAKDIIDKKIEADLFEQFKKLRSIVNGGNTRADSVKNGLDAVNEKTEIVAIHDGARPLVTSDEIERTISKAAETGAACLVAPVIDTIKSVSGGEIIMTIDREKLRRALTPQAFKIEVIRKAFEISDSTAEITDECYLVEKLGHPISIVEGSAQNIKITHPTDSVIVEALLKREMAYE